MHIAHCTYKIYNKADWVTLEVGWITIWTEIGPNSVMTLNIQMRFYGLSTKLDWCKE